jgi:hypothetical protein
MIRRWCGECRAMREVVEEFTDSYMTRDGEIEYKVVVLHCEHQIEEGHHVEVPAPGEPWAPGAYKNRKEAGR